MKTKLKAKFQSIFLLLAVLADVRQAAAQSAQFFQISGPSVTRIISFSTNGTLVWSNALANTNYTIQTVSALPGRTNWVDYVQIPATNRLNTNQLIDFNPPSGMTLIPAGSFTIGNSIGDSDITDAKPTNVYVSAFFMDTNLVSIGQWQTIYNWATSHGYVFTNTGCACGLTPANPAWVVDWYDCVKWCNARSQQASLTPVYYTDAALTKVFTNGEVTVYADWAALGYRLPTEAEWEKAARGGLNKLRFPWGNLISESQANYYGNTGLESYDLGPDGYNAQDTIAGGSPTPVGIFPPNGYGLYDMAGNMFEWCWDWYQAPTYTAGSPYLGGANPHGAATGTQRVLRGGPWYSACFNARCAYRYYLEPSQDISYIGFRCVASQ